MFKNNNLKNIIDRHLNKKIFKENYNITISEKISVFLPILNIYGIFKMRNKLKNNIKRAEKENNQKIDFDLNKNEISSDTFNLFIPIILNLLIILSLSIFEVTNSISLLICGAIIFLLSNVISISLGYAIIFDNIFRIRNGEIEKYINEKIRKENEVLSKEDMIILGKNIDSELLTSFLVNKDFIIRYNDLKELDEEIEKYYKELSLTEKKEKAKKIIDSLCFEEIKEYV